MLRQSAASGGPAVLRRRRGRRGGLRPNAAAGQDDDREHEERTLETWMPLRVLRGSGSGYRPVVTRAAAANALAALALAAAPGPLAGETVAIDPGHNGANYLHGRDRPARRRGHAAQGLRHNGDRDRRRLHRGGLQLRRCVTAGTPPSRGRRARRPHPRDGHRLGPMHHRACGDREPRACGRGDLDPRRWRAGLGPRLPRDLPAADPAADRRHRCR